MVKILIIEDDVEYSNILKQMLERQDYEVLVASDGEEGIKIFRENPVPLVITDILMPNKEGMKPYLSLRESFLM